MVVFCFFQIFYIRRLSRESIRIAYFFQIGIPVTFLKTLRYPDRTGKINKVAVIYIYLKISQSFFDGKLSPKSIEYQVLICKILKTMFF